jgi:hypothetical protein
MDHILKNSSTSNFHRQCTESPLLYSHKRVLDCNSFGEKKSSFQQRKNGDQFLVQVMERELFGQLFELEIENIYILR